MHPNKIVKQAVAKTLFFVLVSASVFLTSCKSVPKDDPFIYSKGEIVYYKINNVPMLVDKQIYKSGKKMYRVVFKNEEGFLMYNTVNEDEILSSPLSD